MRARRSLVSLVAVAAVLLTACGDEDQPSGITTGTTAPTRPAAPLLEHEYVGDDVTVAGEPRPLVDESQLRISFDAEGNLAAGAGCNNLSGAVSLEDLDAGRIRVPQLASTEIGCSEELAEQERWFAELLTSGVSWRFVATSSEIVLTGTVDGEEAVVRLLDEELAVPAMPFEDTIWRSDSLIRDGVVSNAPEDIAATLRFLEDGTVEVSTGCNTGSAHWTLEDDVLTVERVALTRMACGNTAGELEAWLLDVIEEQPVTVERLARRLTLNGANGMGISFSGAQAEDVPASIPGTPDTGVTPSQPAG